jgi:class 3 adenylate cyclase
MTAPAPSGVVTFVFTDIEGSTRRWEADADGMRAALVAHDKVLRSAIEAHDGFLFSHTGDGVTAAFASPRSAVDAAVAAQRALGLPVRMGLATGEAELRDGDYFGTVLNRAARVMAAGHGGQILVADSTAVLLSGLDLVDRGRDGYGMCRTRSRCSRSEHPDCARTFPRCGHWIPVLGICGLPPTASSDVSPNSTRCKHRIAW